MTTPTPSPTPGVVERMSVEEQVGQLMTVAFHGRAITPGLERMIRDRHVGGVILFAENVEDASGLSRLTGDLQAISRQADGRPLFIAIDHEGGSVIRVARGLTVLPGAMALAATPSPAGSVQLASAIAAKELRSAGVTWDLAPVADVLDEPQNAILLNRSFGSDPGRVGELAAAWVRSHAAEGVLSCAKHFPGHGSTTVDPHTGLPELGHDRARLDTIDLVPFRAAVAAGVPTVMTAHILLTAIDQRWPATLSPVVIEEILRRDLGFAGLVVTDDLEMDALRSFGGVPEAAVAALQAGADQLLFRFDEEAQLAAHRLLVEAARDGRLAEARLHTAVERVLAAKAQVYTESPAATDHAEANAAVALDLARHSVTLLRNEGLVPLRGRIAAVSVRQPDISLLPDTLSVGQALHDRGATVNAIDVSQRPDASEIALATGAARSGDVAVAATADLLAHPEQAALVRALAAVRPTVLVSMRSPYDVVSVPEVPAYVCAYYGRPDAARAVAEVLLGEIRPQGRLPVEIPGHFPIGAGLG
ncbi:MAG: glycoside hydrolase family 3 protein [Candidatus Limnocylindria bacterium]